MGLGCGARKNLAILGVLGAERLDQSSSDLVRFLHHIPVFQRVRTVSAHHVFNSQRLQLTAVSIPHGFNSPRFQLPTVSTPHGCSSPRFQLPSGPAHHGINPRRFQLSTVSIPLGFSSHDFKSPRFQLPTVSAPQSAGFKAQGVGKDTVNWSFPAPLSYPSGFGTRFRVSGFGFGG